MSPTDRPTTGDTDVDVEVDEIAIESTTDEISVEEEPATGASVDVVALEAERDFLLRSLDDLETERAAGNLDDERYRELHDDYTARAAAVLRTIEAGVDVRPAAPPVSRRRKVITILAIVGFAFTAAVLLVTALGDRLPGETASGNQQTSPRAQVDALKQQVRQTPNDAGAHLRYAQGLLNIGEIAEAVKQFDQAAMLDPTNAEALAYGGWVVFLAARSAPDAGAELMDGALRRLDAAVAANVDYPDARFFRGMTHLRGKNNPAAAVPDFERYLALVPEGPQVEPVRKLLDEARQASK